MKMDIPLLGMGTWGMGGKYERDPSNREQSVKALRFGLELGIRLIDTAELYGQGLTEEIVGEAIKGLGREDIFLITKVWETNLHHDNLIKSVKGSLRRLQTEYIDLYLVHWPNEGIPLSETMKALESAVDQGLARYIGVSNFSAGLIKEAQGYLDHTVLAANQIEYNLVKREAEKEVIPFCRAEEIQIIAYRPLVKGDLGWIKNPVIQELSQKYRKTPIQIALSWLISQDILVIPKAMSEQHLRENYGALGWKLKKEDVELINKTNFS